MTSAWVQFTKDLEQLDVYLIYLSKIDAIIRHRRSVDEEVADGTTDLILTVRKLRSKKVLEYNLCIITLYGILERFIEDICVQYIDLISAKIQSYSRYPKRIKNNHVGLTTAVIQRLSFPKYSMLRVEDLVGRLHESINNDSSKINSIVFGDHSANVRHSTVCDLYGRLNIDNVSIKIKQTEKFNNYLKEIYGETANYNDIRDSVVFNIINDLAERRNDVSHGVDNGSPILDNGMIKSYINFVKLYGEALLRILESESYTYYIKDEYTSIPAIAIYNNRILCIEYKEGRIGVGDSIIVESTTGFKKVRKVESIQIDKMPIRELTLTKTDEPVKIGLGLDNRIALNQKFYFKKI